jgi:predicted ATPase/DNA-binding SARP family transcriptional activator
VRLEFRILGPLEIVDGANVLGVLSHRQRALLMAFLLRPNTVLSADWLAGVVWPEASHAMPRNTLQVNVSRLRRVLHRDGEPCRIQTRPGGYKFALPEGRLDLQQFEHLAARGRRALADGAYVEAAGRLREALALWRGRPLPEFEGNGYFGAEANRLEELCLTVLDERIEADMALGRHRLLISELRALVEHHPTRERLAGQLMLALYRDGRQTQALETYREVRRRLVDQVGIEPGPILRQLERAILDQDSTLDVAGPSPADARASGSSAGGLIGRQQDLDAIAELVMCPSVRLVTLSGAGGIGKTRLAQAVACRVASRFGGGAPIVDASTARDRSELAMAIAEQLGVETGVGGGIVGSIVSHLRGRPTLLVVDCVEQLLPDVGLLSDLLVQVPDLKLLVTSRIALRLDGEHEYDVLALNEPPASATSLEEVHQYGAAQLLLQRCAARTTRFRARELDVPAVVEICSRLGGVPLALELAAGCVKTLSLAEIAERLDSSLSLLTRGRVDAPERQQTMRATIEWSYRLLDPAHQLLLASVSVFAGGWTLAAAEAVCGPELDVFEGTSALLDASLLQRREGHSGTRFGMLDPVAEFARLQLAELPGVQTIRNRHASYYADTLMGHMDTGRKPDYAHVDAIATDLGNVRAALTWVTGQRGDLAIRLAGGLSTLCRVRGHIDEARGWLEQALDDCGEIPLSLRARALTELSSLALFQDDLEAADATLHETLALGERNLHAGDLVSVLTCLAWLASIRGERQAALDLIDRAVRAGGAGQPADLGLALNHRALVLAELDDLEASAADLEQALQLFRSLDEVRSVVMALSNLSVIRAVLGDLDAAEQLIDECLDIAEPNADAALQACAVSNLAIVELLRGDLVRAAADVADALRRNQHLRDRRGMIENLLVVGAIAGRVGKTDQARALAAASGALHESIGFRLSPGERLLVERYLTTSAPSTAWSGSLERAVEMAWTTLDELGGAFDHVERGVASV